MPSISVAPRDEHMKFYGIVRPIDDPFWTTHLPPSDWNCKCSFEPTNEPVDGDLPLDMPVPAEPLSVNPARTGKVFDESHPYFQKVGNLDQSQNDIILANMGTLVENNITKLIGQNMSNGAIQVKFDLEGIRQAIAEPNNQPFKKLLLMNDIKSLKLAFRESAFELEKDGTQYFSFALGEETNYFAINAESYLVSILNAI